MTTDELLDALSGYGIPSKLMREIQRRFDQLDRDNAYRSREAERQRRYRATKRTRTYADVTDCHVTSQDSAACIEEESKKERRKNTRAKTLLPEDFTLNEADLAACRDEAWTPEKIETELMRFKDDAHAHGRRYIDWHAAWRNWVRSPYQTQGKANGTHQQKPLGLVAAADELLDELRARREANAISDDRGTPSLFAIQNRRNN